MTNFDKWRAYNSGLPSPDNYINWSYYFLIGACLQRRVWTGPASQPLFPNTYQILVGKPGIGKGLVIREVTNFLRHWKLFDVVDKVKGAKSDTDKQEIETARRAELTQANEKEFQGKGAQAKDAIPPLLFPQASDSTTYQALIEAISENYRSINYYQYDETQKKDIIKAYRHSSICFCLQELSSLMRAKTEDIVNFLLGLYDCPLDYEYRTITRSKDRVRRACVNLLAGTTPSYMQTTFDSKIVDEGFSSRTFYICATKNRKNVIRIPEHTPEQKQYKQDLLEHIKNLSFLYGHVRIEESTWIWLEKWWDDYENNKALRANKSPKLEAYYSRKQIHVIKLAMLMHFGEIPILDVPIPKETFERAIEFLEREEKNMHLALVLEGNTPMGRATKLVLELLLTGQKKYVEIYVEVFRILGNKSLCEECINFLEETGQIRKKTVPKEEGSEEVKIYYEIV